MLTPGQGAPRGALWRERAPAKVNLTLRVLGRRADGYHDLVSLVAFAGVGDTLELDPEAPFGLTVDGPTAAGAGEPRDNLVMRAALALAERRPGLRLGGFRLVKRLPAAAGIGGGSSDAAAALRLLARLNGIPLDDPTLLEAARSTGADVPVCLAPRARLMGGTGERIGPPLRLPALFAVLANPSVAVETRSVFASLGLAPGQPLAGPAPAPVPESPSRQPLLDWLASERNDLQAPAIGAAPVVAELIAGLAALPRSRLARMSGSGATCFALFADCHEAAAAARLMRRARPDWWIVPTVLR